MGGQGGCERRTEGGGGVGLGGVRVGVNQELKFFGKLKKKKKIGGGEGGWVHGGPGWGVRMDVNEELKFL